MRLFGLTTFTVERHTKEIGLRMVLAASEAGILVLPQYKKAAFSHASGQGKKEHYYWLMYEMDRSQ
jgi:hypothetical protein